MTDDDGGTPLVPPTGEPPTFELVDDGKRIAWSHDCRANWGDGTHTDFRTPLERLPLHDVTGWQIVRTEPLTVVPSLLCTGCGTHGWITDGRWVPA